MLYFLYVHFYRARSFAKEKERTSELENRIFIIESDIKGIGYQSHAKVFTQTWVNPKSYCVGPAESVRNFSSSPANICVDSGFRGKQQPESMKISIRNKDGKIIFNESVPYITRPSILIPSSDKKTSGYCLELTNQSCETIYSLGLDTEAPKEEDFIKTE